MREINMTACPQIEKNNFGVATFYIQHSKNDFNNNHGALTESACQSLAIPPIFKNKGMGQISICLDPTGPIPVAP